MMPNLNKLDYGFRLLRARLGAQSKSCPYCESKNTVLVERKQIVSELRRCTRCNLQFRYPKDMQNTSTEYYQDTYREPHAQNFEELYVNGDADALIGPEAANQRLRVNLAREYRDSGRLFEFGCSWGYGSVLFRDAGHEVVGFEISKPRAEVARTVFGLNVLSDVSAVSSLPTASFDLIYCSHVLEHLPDLRSALSEFRRLIRDDGVAVFFVPNGGGRSAKALGVKWGALISEEHCLALDAAFFSGALPEIGFKPEFRCDPYDGQATADPASDLDGDELMVIARPI